MTTAHDMPTTGKPPVVPATTTPLRVVCIQRRLTHYRVPLFERMRDHLAARGIRFELVYGDPMASERSKRDDGQIDWGTHVQCRYFMGGKLCWQDATAATRGADLVIVTQENKLLFNYLLLTLRRPRRLAFWGHGRNFQTDARDGLRERFKRQVSVRVDWWFAYTALSQRLVQAMGFASQRITNLENAIDTRAFAALCDEVSSADAAAFRMRWRMGDGPVGVFVGSLYAEKRIEFLLEAGARLATSLPGFTLLMVGDGPQRDLVESACKRAPWLRYGGVQFGRDKALCLRSADLMLNPGLVGLGILDAFAAGLPMATTDCHLHSPEIDYLRSGENGIMTANDIDIYVDTCQALLTDATVRRRLGERAREDADHYTIDNMAHRFCDGIVAALRAAPA